jgi:xanthine/uracil permease
MPRRPEDLIYTVDERPPLPTLLALGVQYTALMSIYLVIVVIVFATRAPLTPRRPVPSASA